MTKISTESTDIIRGYFAAVGNYHFYILRVVKSDTSPRLAVTERGENTLQKPVPCHSERTARRVELLRHAAKALWALAPCGIWDGRLVYTFVPRDLVGRAKRKRHGAAFSRSEVLATRS